MASLKDILPLLLAGGAGAASPQGADVFNNILRQKRIGEQQDRQERESDERLTLARLASDRAGRAEERAITSQEGSISLRQMRMDAIDRDNKERDRTRASESKIIDFYAEKYPELAATGVFEGDLTKADAGKIVESFGGKTFEEQMDEAQIAKDRGLSASLPIQGGGSVGTGPAPRQGKASKEPVEFTDAMAASIYHDAQADISNAQEKLEKAQINLMSLEGDNGQDVITPAALESARAEVRARERDLQRAQEQPQINFRNEGASEAQINSYWPPPPPPGSTQPVPSHGALDPQGLIDQVYGRK